MKSYLSFGGGVNSTALMLLLLDRGIEFEPVYADHGADWPETREYVAMLQDRGYAITVLETRREGLGIYEYYWQYRCIPMRVARWCTVHWKVRPLNAYMSERPCTVYLGIDYSERHRSDKILRYEREGEKKEFPLVEDQIDRRGCTEIIESHGLPVPMKSGCYFCPHQRVGQVRDLRTRHPELFCKALALERRSNEMRGTSYFLVDDRPFDEVAMDMQADLFGERDMSPCLCGL